MELIEAKTRKDLETLYDELRLTTIEEKIQYLIDTMHVKAILGHYNSVEDDLIGLEETALLGTWPAFI